MLKPIVKVIELLLDENEEAILESVSLVDNPAIQRAFLYFSDDTKRFVFEDEEQRILVGPAMVPGMKIPRKEKNGEVYYVYFTEDTVAKAAELFLKYDKASAQNTDHRNNFNKDIYVMESWIIEDENDKAFSKYDFKALPIGTWMLKMRVLDDKVWREVKAGKLNGFSVQGDFILGESKYEQAFGSYPKKYKKVRMKWKDLYKGLNNYEKSKLDQVLFLVELNSEDYYEKVEDAIKRSKELGLKGEVHSHYDEDLGVLIYMPGKSHDEYEKALESIDDADAVSVEDEYDYVVGGLPGYVKPGATGTPAPIAPQMFNKVSFDWDETLSTPRGKEYFMRRKQEGDTLYIISAGNEVTGAMKNFALQNGIPLSRVIATGSNANKVEAVKRLFIDSHYDNNPEVVKQLGTKGIKFAAVEDIKVGDAVSWKTQDQNPRGRVRDIVREGSQKVPGRDFEVTGTPEDPGYIIEIYEQNAEGNWAPTGEFVGRKADSILLNVTL